MNDKCSIWDKTKLNTTWLSVKVHSVPFLDTTEGYTMTQVLLIIFVCYSRHSRHHGSLCWRRDFTPTAQPPAWHHIRPKGVRSVWRGLERRSGRTGNHPYVLVFLQWEILQVCCGDVLTVPRCWPLQCISTWPTLLPTTWATTLSASDGLLIGLPPPTDSKSTLSTVRRNSFKWMLHFINVPL